MIALLDLLEEHREAVEYDLIALGLRLRDFPNDHFTWRDLLVICRNAPPGSALYLAQHGEMGQWSKAEQLLHSAEWTLRILWWAQTKDGQAGRNFPEPLPAPWVEPTTKKYGKGAIPYDEMAEWLGWDTPGANN